MGRVINSQLSKNACLCLRFRTPFIVTRIDQVLLFSPKSNTPYFYLICFITKHRRVAGYFWNCWMFYHWIYLLLYVLRLNAEFPRFQYCFFFQLKTRKRQQKLHHTRDNTRFLNMLSRNGCSCSFSYVIVIFLIPVSLDIICV